MGNKRVLFAGKYTYGLKRAWQKLGYQTWDVEEDLQDLKQEQVRKLVGQYLRKYNIDILFSFDYLPFLAEECFQRKIRYISWVWDCPHSTLWSKTARYDTNLIFLFDYVQYQKQLSRKLTNVFHLPLSADVDDFTEIIKRDAGASAGKYQADVAFMGNLYNGKENTLFEQISYLPPYTEGYLNALIEIQRKIWGMDLLEECIADKVWDDLKQYVHWDLGDRYETDVYEVEMKSIIGKRIAQLERKEMCSYLARHFDFALYTGSDISYDPQLQSRGYVSYRTEMPLLFHYSKININLTIRPITSGVPLRVMDVLACEGFLLTNYQPEIAEYFENGKELVMFDNFVDLYEKIAYYLEHEQERKQIAHAGYLKVKEQFHYEKQVEKIVSVLKELEE